MPFTISHAAGVLPFARFLGRWRVLSALVIGSMAPDFGLFLPWQLPRFETHSAAALLTFSLPAGLIVYWIFQRLIKTALRQVLPDDAYDRSLRYAPIADIASARQWLIAACGVLIGAVTHLVWDAFTHEGARGVRMLPAIDEWFVEVAGHELAGPRFLQDLSSLLGLIVVAWFLWRSLRNQGTPLAAPRRLQASERRFWRWAYALTAIAVVAADLMLTRWTDSHPLGITHSAGDAAIASLRGLAASLFCVSLCLDIRLRVRP